MKLNEEAIKKLIMESLEDSLEESEELEEADIASAEKQKSLPIQEHHKWMPKPILRFHKRFHKN